MQIMNTALQPAHAKHAENTASPQLRQAANGFEASFLQELLKPMSEDAMFGANGESSGSMGTVSSMAAQALADGIAKDGGLGIAKRVLAELAPVEAAQSGKAGVTGGTQCGGCAQQLPSAAKTTGEDFAASGSAKIQNQDKTRISPQEMY